MEYMGMFVFVALGIVLGIGIGYVLFSKKGDVNIYETKVFKDLDQKLRKKIEELQDTITSLNQENSVLETQVDHQKKAEQHLKEELSKHNIAFSSKEQEFTDLKVAHATLENEVAALKEKQQKESETLAALNEKIEKLQEEKHLLTNQLSVKENDLENSASQFKRVQEALDNAEEIKKELEENQLKNLSENAALKVENTSLLEKLESQKVAMKNLQETFEKEFKISSQKILEANNERFIKDHEKSLGDVIKPLEKDLKGFKEKVEELYANESKERFNLGKELQKLNELNQNLKDEAHNLTQALKTESKTQGGWGEMILESVLEKSGLRKDEEYFMEHQLFDDHGKALRSDAENKKMRPDAVIKYPGDRHVIIDSKVSLNSFLRYVDGDTDAIRKIAIEGHVKAIKNHIDALSSKGYDDYDKALDFVMLFIPSEPAYIAAVQQDPNLWNYAYEKRILLLNPTNLITSLKLIVDLWKREYQNKNVQAIIDRGSKMYDKFAGFVNDLDAVGDYMDKAQNKHKEAFKKLKTGNDNLVLQMDKLKNLGIKNKKELSQGIVDESKSYLH
ncbi:MAG: DNA recombination protein RmuC [Flavicella sp.]